MSKEFVYRIGWDFQCCCWTCCCRNDAETEGNCTGSHWCDQQIRGGPALSRGWAQSNTLSCSPERCLGEVRRGAASAVVGAGRTRCAFWREGWVTSLHGAQLCYRGRPRPWQCSWSLFLMTVKRAHSCQAVFTGEVNPMLKSRRLARL